VARGSAQGGPLGCRTTGTPLRHVLTLLGEGCSNVSLYVLALVQGGPLGCRTTGTPLRHVLTLLGEGCSNVSLYVIALVHGMCTAPQ
jgi:hypothetical protein